MPRLTGMDAAASALRYWERKQEVVANNLANVSTGAFKGQRVFARLLDGMQPAAESSTDLATGELRQTGSPLDVALEGDGFFVVSTALGERYTRGGSLRVDAEHRLVDSDARPLLGVKGPIVVGDGPIEIDHTGEVKQGGQTIDRLRIETATGADLTREGSSAFVPPAARKVVAPEGRTIKQGYLEDSNVNSMGALVDMVAVQRAYASVQKAIVQMDQVHETAIRLGKPS
jgi:flagellar basal-body rod protein FlgF